MLGVAIGFVLMTLIVGAGLAQVFDRYPVSYDILKVVSVVYLLFLAWKIANAAPVRVGRLAMQPDSPDSPDLDFSESQYDNSDKCTNAELVIAIKEFDIAMANQIEASYAYRRAIQHYFVNGDTSNREEYTQWLTRTIEAYDRSHDYVKTATVNIGKCYD